MVESRQSSPSLTITWQIGQSNDGQSLQTQYHQKKKMASQPTAELAGMLIISLFLQSDGIVTGADEVFVSPTAHLNPLKR